MGHKPGPIHLDVVGASGRWGSQLCTGMMDGREKTHLGVGILVMDRGGGGQTVASNNKLKAKEHAGCW